MASPNVTLDRSSQRIKMRIEVQDSAVDEQFGTPQKSFTPVLCDGRQAFVVGRVETLSGRELELARRLVSNATHRVTIPYISFLGLKHRFVVAKNERVLEIGHLNDVEMAGVTHICTCEEVVASAGSS